jgi:hypothetical protein
MFVQGGGGGELDRTAEAQQDTQHELVKGKDCASHS